MSLKDHAAIVTGGAKGIGRAIVERFARDGARLVIADTDEGAGEKLREEIVEAGGEAIFIDCDVSDRLDVHNLVAAAIDAYGRIDTLVNNAGIIAGADFLDYKEDDFDRVLAVNLKGPFLVGQAVARQMVKQIAEEETKPRDVRAAIVNMSSVNAVLAIPNQLAYVTSKGGLNQMTKVMALSLAPHGIRVNAIGPGSIQTDVLKAVMGDEAAKRKILSRTPIGRIGQPEEIAELAAFLASPAASYLTGTCIYADGGRMGLNYLMPTDEE
ncbi:SDR family NAD(P)-dependent oxidoreductase [Futiania mangrovi]|uniref:3-oxoacyl-ACP reductase FabG n=1 Tax=Futiania mangrovi TaxID=2959716 RepID=A0A9J6PE17_9PROT|nr:3-oxoacyl-ACP reductase family protein [Futiania mangrovii]MCP1334863.1 3-oxoacyl-ACP reductase FabG [Futiania mangrovii]